MTWATRSARRRIPTSLRPSPGWAGGAGCGFAKELSQAHARPRPPSGPQPGRRADQLGAIRVSTPSTSACSRSRPATSSTGWRSSSDAQRRAWY